MSEPIRVTAMLEEGWSGVPEIVCVNCQNRKCEAVGWAANAGSVYIVDYDYAVAHFRRHDLAGHILTESVFQSLKALKISLVRLALGGLP